MAIAWAGHVESNGTPESYYEYTASYSNRTKDSVHVKLYVSLRMKYYTNYFSFAIAHECKVNGVYQYANIKTTRKFWGHQWAGNYNGGGDFYWNQNEYDYAGDAWHGPFLVFDGTVPIGVDDATVNIVPCITRPPITGLGGSGIYASNPQDVNNWSGCAGVWRPWGATEYRGSYANSGNHGDGCFLNNRGLQGLSGGLWVGQYPRPANVSGLVVSPTSINVNVQDTQAVTAKWNVAQRAVGYDVYISKGSPGSNRKSCGSQAGTTFTILPKSKLGSAELFDGDKVYIGVQSYDSNGIRSKSITWSSAITYFEIPSEAPNSGYLLGRKGEKNMILYRGENADLHYTGEKDGSYPIARYEFVRLADNVTVKWNRNDAKLINGERIKNMFVTGVPEPRLTRVWELRCYNTKNRPVYMKGTKSWLRISVFYFGGIIYVYDGKWHEGIAWVYNNGKWHDASAVYVHRNGEWKTL